MSLLKKITNQLPEQWQTELKRIHYRRQIKKDNFITEEPEYNLLHNFIKDGDWILDIGANVGHYTKRLSELVGANGRVIAFEPVPITFFILSANSQLFKYQNVTLINAAVSDNIDTVGITIPKFLTGLNNYYQAHLTSDKNSTLSVLTLALDSIICIHQKIALIKIDVEGHESSVLAGMKNIINLSHPVLIVETSNKEVTKNIQNLGYDSKRLPNSPNVLFEPKL